MKPRSLSGLVLAGVILGSGAIQARALTRYVSPNGTQTSPFTNWTDAATNVGAALAVAQAGDVILLTNGTYRLSSELLLDRAVTIRSVNGYRTTALDGANVCRIAQLADPDAALDGLTIQNGAAISGGGVFLNFGGTVSNCRILTNAASLKGGGVYASQGGLVRNCLIAGNTASADLNAYGGGVCLNGGGRLENCTVVSNTAAGTFAEGGGVHCSGGVLLNSIVIFNLSPYAPNVHDGGGSYTNCCTLPALSGPGNIAADPLFVNPAALDYSLQRASPCVAAGDNAMWQPGDLDLEANERVVDGTVDLGALETTMTGLVGTPWKGFEPLPVVFTSLLSVPQPSETLYAWDFDGDGTPEIQGFGLRVVTNRYANRGVYDVALIVSNAVNGAQSVRKPHYIHVDPSMLFEAVPLAGFDPLAAAFEARLLWPATNGVFYAWDFDNDGTIDRSGYGLAAVTNWYAAAGVYSVALTVSNNLGQVATLVRTNLCEVGRLWCDFTTTVLADVYPPAVAFTAAVSGKYRTGLAYAWDFDNDGSVELTGSARAIVTNGYPWGFRGAYVGRLIVSNSYGEALSTVRTNFYDGGKLRCRFSGGPLVGFAPLQVALQAELAGRSTTNTSIRWDFGDGGPPLSGTDLLAATNRYALPGRFTVSLLVSNAAGEVASSVVTNAVESRAAVIYVSPLGSHQWPYADWASAATNLHAAVAAAADGTLVRVGPALYELPTQLTITNGLTLRGEEGYRSTIISGGNTSRCILVTHNQAVVEGFTVTRGVSDNGGGINIQGRGTVRRCRITENRSTGSGGGVVASGGSTVENCLVDRNVCTGTAWSDGGGLSLGSDAVVRNCTVVSNSVGSGWQRGGGVTLNVRGAIYDSVVFGNSSATSPNIYSWLSTVVNCRTDDPRFVRFGKEDYHLLSDSPCIDRGTSLVWSAEALDLDGRERRHGAAPDQGAYEYGLPTCTIAATPRSGLAPLVVVLDATVSGADTGSLHFAWDVDGDGRTDIAGPDAATITNTYAAPGRYSVSLTVSNAVGETGACFRVALVDALPPLPLTGNFAIAPTQGPVPLTVVFTAQPAGSYTNGLSYGWDFDGDGVVDASGPGLGRVTNVYTAFRTYSPTLRMSNSLGEVAVVTRTNGVTADPAPLSCDFTVSPYDAPFPHTPLFTAQIAGSFQDGLYCWWDFDNDTINDVGGSNLVQVSHTYAQPGEFSARLTVSNALGQLATILHSGITSFIPAIHVSPSGSDTYPYTNWTTAARTLGAAAQAALDGSKIIVTNGRYLLTGEIVINKAATVRSVNGPRVTTVVGGGQSSCFNLSHSNAVLDGFEIVGGGGYTNGGGVFCFAGTPRVKNCLIHDNTARLGGGAYQGTLQNCVIYSNTARFGGGAYGSIVEHCTVINNYATWRGGGLYVSSAINSILLDNLDYYGDAWSSLSDSSGSYCCTTPMHDGVGNFQAYPHFVNPDTNDFRLMPDSPCIDAGTNGVCDTDMEGRPRPLDGNTNGIAVADVGAYEFMNPSADTDGDGMTDGAEDIAGTLPNDPDSVFKVDAVSAVRNASGVVLRWMGRSGRRYSVLFKTDPLSSAWTPMPGLTNLVGSDAPMACTNAVGVEPRTYFSVGVTRFP